MLGAWSDSVLDEEARAIARGSGRLRDEFRRERVVEVSGAQGAKLGLEFEPEAVVGRRWGKPSFFALKLWTGSNLLNGGFSEAGFVKARRFKLARGREFFPTQSISPEKVILKLLKMNE